MITISKISAVTHTHTNIYIYHGGIHGVMVTIIGNGSSNPSSNPGLGSWNFT